MKDQEDAVFDCPYGLPLRECCERFPCSKNFPLHPDSCPGCQGAMSELECARFVESLPESYDFTEERNALLANLLPDGASDGWQQALVDEFVDYVIGAAECEKCWEAKELRMQVDAVSAAIGTTAYMDPPDGGSVSLAEQVARMRDDHAAALAEWREIAETETNRTSALHATIAAQRALLERAAWALAKWCGDTPWFDEDTEATLAAIRKAIK